MIPSRTVNILDRGYCGQDSNGFFDRKGDYFRKGVDPRNHVGRLIRMKPRSGWVHDYDCPAGFSDVLCDCGEPS